MAESVVVWCATMCNYMVNTKTIDLSRATGRRAALTSESAMARVETNGEAKFFSVSSWFETAIFASAPSALRIRTFVFRIHRLASPFRLGLLVILDVYKGVYKSILYNIEYNKRNVKGVKEAIRNHKSKTFLRVKIIIALLPRSSRRGFYPLLLLWSLLILKTISVGKLWERLIGYSIVEVKWEEEGNERGKGEMN